MQVPMNVSHLAVRLAEEVRTRGLADATVAWYRNASRALARAAEEAGESEWSDTAERKCPERVADRLRAGEIGAKTYVRYVRVARMMASLADTGEVDFSRSPVAGGRYPVSGEAAKAVEGILADACVLSSAFEPLSVIFFEPLSVTHVPIRKRCRSHDCAYHCLGTTTGAEAEG